MLKLLIISLFSVATFAGPLDNVQTALNSTVYEEHKDESMKLMFNGAYLSLSNGEEGTTLSGMGVGFQAMYILNSKFGLGGGAGTTMSQGGAGAATILNWAFTYSLMGSLTSTESSYSLNGRAILSSTNSIAEGLRVQVLLSQYYFNATQNTIPYAGIGGHLYYDKYVEYLGTNVIVGFRFEQLFNNELTLTPMTLTFGILI